MPLPPRPFHAPSRRLRAAWLSSRVAVPFLRRVGRLVTHPVVSRPIPPSSRRAPRSSCPALPLSRAVGRLAAHTAIRAPRPAFFAPRRSSQRPLCPFCAPSRLLCALFAPCGPSRGPPQPFSHRAARSSRPVGHLAPTRPSTRPIPPSLPHAPHSQPLHASSPCAHPAVRCRHAPPRRAPHAATSMPPSDAPVRLYCVPHTHVLVLPSRRHIPHPLARRHAHPHPRWPALLCAAPCLLVRRPMPSCAPKRAPSLAVACPLAHRLSSTILRLRALISRPAPLPFAPSNCRPATPCAAITRPRSRTLVTPSGAASTPSMPETQPRTPVT
ncbi:hypothetical protein DENSPDRAFT_886952 [Dentipellis sp. KUC8613]|nr:hypothetical protein DENSPDRAFT_886952 [Dentipellis sp. KUC8613]